LALGFFYHRGALKNISGEKKLSIFMTLQWSHAKFSTFYHCLLLAVNLQWNFKMAVGASQKTLELTFCIFKW